MGNLKIKCIILCFSTLGISAIFAQPQEDKIYEPVVRLQSLEIPQGWTEKQMLEVIYQALAEYSGWKMPGRIVSGKCKISWRIKTYILPLPRKPKLKPGEKEIMGERIGPQPNGLMFTIYYSSKDVLGQLDRPCLLKNYCGVPWYTYCGLVDIKGSKVQIEFNLSYASKTDKKLLEYFSDAQNWLKSAMEYSNTAHKNPAAPPADRVLADFSIDELLLYFKGKKDKLPDDKLKIINEKLEKSGDRFFAPYAAAWFIWKTKDTKDGLALREKLADIIELRINALYNEKRTITFCDYFFQLLPPLDAKEQINRLAEHYLIKKKCNNSFFAPLVRAWGEVISIDDLPKMIGVADNGGDGWPECINNELERITGWNIPLNNGKVNQQAWLLGCNLWKK